MDPASTPCEHGDRLTACSTNRRRRCRSTRGVVPRAPRVLIGAVRQGCARYAQLCAAVALAWLRVALDRWLERFVGQDAVPARRRGCGPIRSVVSGWRCGHVAHLVIRVERGEVRRDVAAEVAGDPRALVI